MLGLREEHRIYEKECTIILELLDAEYRWWYALELIDASDGKLKRGTVHIQLGMLEDEGHIESDTEKAPWPGLWTWLRQLGKKKRSRYRIIRNGLRQWQEDREGPEDSELVPHPA